MFALLMIDTMNNSVLIYREIKPWIQIYDTNMDVWM